MHDTDSYLYVYSSFIHQLYRQAFPILNNNTKINKKTIEISLNNSSYFWPDEHHNNSHTSFIPDNQENSQTFPDVFNSPTPKNNASACYKTNKMFYDVSISPLSTASDVNTYGGIEIFILLLLFVLSTIMTIMKHGFASIHCRDIHGSNMEYVDGLYHKGVMSTKPTFQKIAKIQMLYVLLCGHTTFVLLTPTYSMTIIDKNQDILQSYKQNKHFCRITGDKYSTLHVKKNKRRRSPVVNGWT